MVGNYGLVPEFKLMRLGRCLVRVASVSYDSRWLLRMWACSGQGRNVKVPGLLRTLS